MDSPPLAARRPHSRVLHGTVTEDPYAWMRQACGLDSIDDQLRSLVEAENDHTNSVCASEASLRELLFCEIKGRVNETDLSLPVRRGEWWYQTRTIEGLDYPIHIRLPDTGDGVPPTADATAEVILDENVVARGYDYSQIGAAGVSPDGTLLAWSVDHTGDETHTLFFRDLLTGVDRREMLHGVGHGLAWSADSTWLFYETMDASHRPNRVWRHRLGTDQSADTIVFEEADERFFVSVDANRSDDWIVISSQSAVTGDVHVLDAHHPTDRPRRLTERIPDVDVSVEVHRDRAFILTNADGAADFALFSVSTTNPDEPWRCVVPHEPGVRLEGCDVFASHLVVQLRRNASTGLRVIDLSTGSAHDLEFPDEVGTVSPDANLEFDTSTYRITYQSLTTPPSVFEVDLDTHERTLLRQLDVRGGYDRERYVSTRIWVRGDDGTLIPVSLVHHADTMLDGSAPALLYGYGAYEISMDPWFSIPRLSLLDRGWVFAIAHVRGGGELGRSWYLDGKFARKVNSFTDFVACARHLIDAGYTAADRLVARGASAGGLLVGAVINLAPELFAAAIAEVPFVDPLNTLVDPTLPLTVTEWDEWGNPIDDPEAFADIAGYSPYENIRADAYPAVLATAGVSDPRVSVHEPAKWVQRLRSTTTGERPILLKTDLSAGHGGPTGRYDAWRAEAFILSFAVANVPRLTPRKQRSVDTTG